MNVQLASASLTTGAPDTGAPILDQVLEAKSLTAGPSVIGANHYPHRGLTV